MQDFLFVDLAGLAPGKPFAGFAAGAFTDMHGRAVEFTLDTLREVAANTQKAISVARRKKMPGLPIDARSHNKGDAAGWITSAAEGEVEDSDGRPVPVIMLGAEWTKLGQELLSERILANFSPTVDLRNKTIRGGSLTNWPASVDANGYPLFPAVELAQGMYTLAEGVEEPLADDTPGDEPEATEAETAEPPADIVTTPVDEAEPDDRAAVEEIGGQESAPTSGEIQMEITKEELSALIAEQVSAALASFQKPAEEPAATPPADLLKVLEMSGATDEVTEAIKQQYIAQFELVQKRAAQEAAEMIARVRRENDIADFAQGVTGGTPETPYGLPVGVEDLKEFLGRLQPADLEFAKKLLSDIQAHGRSKFTELGHGKRMVGGAQLPAAYALALDSGELKISDLTAPELALGDLAQYDLSRWNGGK
jgi:hypothetical protein